MCGVFLFAAKSTSTALNSTHFPSGEGTGSETRFSFIMSSKVKGCLAWENEGREKRRTKRKTKRRITCLRRTKKCSTGGQRSDCRVEASSVAASKRNTKSKRRKDI